MSFTPRRSLGSQGVAPGRASFSPLTPVVRPLSTPLLQLMVRRERLVFLEPGGGPDARTDEVLARVEARAAELGYVFSVGLYAALNVTPSTRARRPRRRPARAPRERARRARRPRAAVPQLPGLDAAGHVRALPAAHAHARVREPRAAVPELHDRRPRVRARPVRAPRVHDLLGREGLQRVPDLPPADRPGQPVRAARAGSRAALGPAPAHAPGRRPRPRRHRHPRLHGPAGPHHAAVSPGPRGPRRARPPLRRRAGPGAHPGARDDGADLRHLARVRPRPPAPEDRHRRPARAGRRARRRGRPGQAAEAAAEHPAADPALRPPDRSKAFRRTSSPRTSAATRGTGSGSARSCTRTSSRPATRTRRWRSPRSAAPAWTTTSRPGPPPRSRASACA